MSERNESLEHYAQRTQNSLSVLKVWWHEPREGRWTSHFKSWDSKRDTALGDFEPGASDLAKRVLVREVGKFKGAELFVNDGTYSRKLKQYGPDGGEVPFTDKILAPRQTKGLRSPPT